MKITSVVHHSKEEMLKKFKNVTLFRNNKKTPPVYIFKKAIITLEEFSLENIYPAQFYFLQESLEKKQTIQHVLQKRNIDVFHLDGYVTYEADGKDYTFLPPILEYTQLPDGREVAIIADGFHRISLAKSQKKKSIQVVVIKNIPQKYAYPALPNPKGWKDVTIAGLPDDPAQKRLWRYPIEKAYAHYHDFGGVFTNASKPLSLTKIGTSNPQRYAVEVLEESEEAEDFPPAFS